MKLKLPYKPLLSAFFVAISSVTVTQVATAQTIPAMSESKMESAKIAIDTLSKQLSIKPEKINVIHVSDMNWPDSSLGCPKPGVNYLQVVTRGSLVLLQSNKKTYRVHIAKNRAILCEKPMRGNLPLGSNKTASSSVQGLMQKSRSDLAQKLGVNISEIYVVKLESRIWPDSALGCAAPVQGQSREKVKGFLITMEYKDQQYRYHTDQKNVTPCPAIETE